MSEIKSEPRIADPDNDQEIDTSFSHFIDTVQRELGHVLESCSQEPAYAALSVRLDRDIRPVIQGLGKYHAELVSWTPPVANSQAEDRSRHSILERLQFLADHAARMAKQVRSEKLASELDSLATLVQAELRYAAQYIDRPMDGYRG